MLVLSRRQGESIVLDHNIVITIVEIRGDFVRIRIEAPDGTAIHRKEALEQVRRNHSTGAGPITMDG